jgi:hypothetical protein
MDKEKDELHQIGKSARKHIPGFGSTGSAEEFNALSSSSVCLLLVWCTVACALSRCRPLPVLPGVAPFPSAPSGVPRPKPLWSDAWSPICFFFSSTWDSFEKKANRGEKPNRGPPTCKSVSARWLQRCSWSRVGHGRDSSSMRCKPQQRGEHSRGAVTIDNGAESKHNDNQGWEASAWTRELLKQH